MGLSVNNLVNVSINLSPTGASVRSFGTLMIAGDSDVINGVERFRTYTTIEAVAEDFGVNAPEYKAAALYYSQNPQPRTLMIGRWFSSASAGENVGGILTSAEALLSAWTSISAGSFEIDVDGVTYTLSNLDFTGETNLNGVATVITTALDNAGSTATCEWNGSYFTIISGSTGAGAHAEGTITFDSNPSYGVQASGTITLSGQPSNGDTLNINGTTVTFVSGTPTGNQVQIGGSTADTSAALQTFLANSADVNLAACVYNTISLVTTVTARAFGTAGNSYVLSESATNVAVSGSGTLAGGVAANTITVNGVAITFVNANPTGNQCLVGATKYATAANLQTFLAASANTSIDDATYSLDSTVITVTAVLAGTAGNSFTLAETGSAITVTATLSGGAEPSAVGYASATGSGTDISEQLKLSEDTSQALIPGYDAETPAECAAVLANMSANWYGLMFAATDTITDDENLDVCDFIEAQSLSRVFGITIQNTNVLSSLVSNDLASMMKDAAYSQSCCQYSSSSPYAIASFMGRAFSVNFLQQNSTITLMFKQEPGVTAEDLTETQALTLKNKNCNVFVEYVNDTMILQYGNMSSGQFFDTIHGCDWLQNAIQTNVYNLLYTSGKIPQTDAGVNQVSNAIAQICAQAVNNGLVAPGTWNGPSFGQLQTGQYLKSGYYIYAQSVALQSQADRAARMCPPIQVAIKLAGAIQSVDILVNVEP